MAFALVAAMGYTIISLGMAAAYVDCDGDCGLAVVDGLMRG